MAKVKTHKTPGGFETYLDSPGRSNETKTFESPKSKKKKMKGSKEEGASSDEERWLNAIQSGKLEEVDDELKKIKRKDPKLMTARQRAMLERKGDTGPDPAAEQLMSLPSGYKEKVLTPEMEQKKALKQLKRKQLMDEKREKDKKRTMERILKKQDNKQTKQALRKPVKRSGLSVCYRMNDEGVSLTFPHGMDYPIVKKTQPPPPPVVKCAIGGCKNVKKYTCSKTGVPLCSLRCYKLNLASISVTPARHMSKISST